MIIVGLEPCYDDGSIWVEIKAKTKSGKTRKIRLSPDRATSFGEELRLCAYIAKEWGEKNGQDHG